MESNKSASDLLSQKIKNIRASAFKKQTLSNIPSQD